MPLKLRQQTGLQTLIISRICRGKSCCENLSSQGLDDVRSYTRTDARYGGQVRQRAKGNGVKPGRTQSVESEYKRSRLSVVRSRTMPKRETSPRLSLRDQNRHTLKLSARHCLIACLMSLVLANLPANTSLTNSSSSESPAKRSATIWLTFNAPACCTRTGERSCW